MLVLREKITQFAKVPKDGVIKVDSFLNHLIDPELMIEIGKEIASRFKNKNIDKVLTIEASGIAPALGTALCLKVPVLFAKKSMPSTMIEGYSAKVHSFTKDKDYDIFVSKEYLKEGENILIVDDFLAMGSAIMGMKYIIDEAKANCIGAGIVIEKSFQLGRGILEKNNILIESIVRIKSISVDKGIEFLI